MSYIIVTDQSTVVGAPFNSFPDALEAASQIFGDDTALWLELNIRIEENRPFALN